MRLPKAYLEYPHRRYGMDHEHYDWSILPRRPPVRWPDGARIALWVVPALEWFPLDMSSRAISVPGALDRPYPDYWNYTLRDYGTRVGYFRMARALHAFGLRATVAVNSAIAERHPNLIDDVNARGWEIMAHGVDMDHPHHGGLNRAVEAEQIDSALSTLRRLSGQPITGWLSPGKSESANTLELLAGHGVEYVGDWINDDLPYRMRTGWGDLVSMPHPYETDDQLILGEFQHTEDQYLQQLRDQFDTLYAESAADNGRLFALSLHPWVIGQPFRIHTLERALGYVLAHSGVWPASRADIVAAFQSSAEA